MSCFLSQFNRDFKCLLPANWNAVWGLEIKCKKYGIRISYVVYKIKCLHNKFVQQTINVLGLCADRSMVSRIANGIPVTFFNYLLRISQQFTTG